VSFKGLEEKKQMDSTDIALFVKVSKGDVVKQGNADFSRDG
jgi:hypothetical protein